MFTVTLKVKVSDLGYYDTKIHSWRLDGGIYTFIVGSSSKSIRFSDDIQLNEPFIETIQALLGPEVKYNELSKH